MGRHEKVDVDEQESLKKGVLDTALPVRAFASQPPECKRQIF